MTDERAPIALQIKRRAQVRRRRRRVTVVVAVLVLAAVAAWIVAYSPALTVRQVRVEGASLVTSDEVVAAAAVGLGQPMVRVDGGAVAARVTAALPAVASAKVSRQWPGTLVIKVTERAIVYQVASGGGYDWVSADGTVFNNSTDAQPVPQASVALNDPSLLGDVAVVVQALPADVATHVQSMAAPTPDSITIELDGDRQVVWGSADQSDLKAQVLVPLLNIPGHVYDVSAPSNPAVR